MSNLYSTYDSANHYEVAFHACPTNLRIIQAKNRKAKSRAVVTATNRNEFGRVKTIVWEAKGPLWGVKRASGVLHSGYGRLSFEI